MHFWHRIVTACIVKYDRARVHTQGFSLHPNNRGSSKVVINYMKFTLIILVFRYLLLLGNANNQREDKTS